MPKCELGHWKHALQRWDRGGPRIVSGLGFHTASSAAPLIEPTVPVFAHHFPYRSEAAARLRLAKLFGAEDALTRVLEDDPAHAQMRTRMAAIDAVYAQRWNEAVFPACVPGFTPELQPWDEIDPADCSVARWY